MTVIERWQNATKHVKVITFYANGTNNACLVLYSMFAGVSLIWFCVK